ncbi:unnamed protein product [Caenorhabditis sp. 36 PRJEB53466]|nr:unnamed protein product [Caenorhabditis sp. 36 PRJEB53466]
MFRPTPITAMGKARRRSGLLRPAITKSPRSTIRRTVPGSSVTTRIDAPLPPTFKTGRSTIGVPGDLNASRANCSKSTALNTSRLRPSVIPTPRSTRHAVTSATRPPVPSSSQRTIGRTASVTNRQPSELEKLKEKLSDLEEQLAVQKGQSEMFRDMSHMQKTMLETCKIKLEKTEMDLVGQKEMNITLKQQLEITTETLREKENIIKEVSNQLNQKEITLRKLHNDVVDLRGQIRVAVRVRPLLKSEESANAIEYPAVNAVSVITGSKSSGQFDFEKVFTPVFSQKEVFVNIEDFILSALHGYNVGLVAFGQTGSGKTHTMRGGEAEEEGVIPRSGAFLFNEAQRLAATGWAFEFTLSFLEIYNNEAYDLLNNHKPIKLRLGNKDVALDGLSEHPLTRLVDLAEYLRRADNNRKTAATKCNQHSSRSHAIYMWNIKAHQESTGISTTSVLKLVDLAGSERAKESGVTGQQFSEMTAINTSLSVLQKCIGLQKSKAKHVPYRESKLTQVLMDCLGRGNSKTMVIVNINPCGEQSQESKRSIEFAARMRDTHIGSAVQQRDL